MATVPLQQFDNGAVRVEYDYDDVSRRVNLIRCVNNGSGNVRVTLWTAVDGALVDQKYFPPSTTLVSILKFRLVVANDKDGNPIFPYGYRIEYPAGG